MYSSDCLIVNLKKKKMQKIFLLSFFVRMITETIYEKSVDICVFVKKKKNEKGTFKET